MIEIFKINLNANETREFVLSGEYFEVRNANYPIELIELTERSGGVLSRLVKPEESDFVRPGTFETIRVTNGPTEQTCQFFIGSGDSGSRRTSGTTKVNGVVQVAGLVSIDGVVQIDGKVHVENFDNVKAESGLAFTAHMFALASGNYSALQLWNPPGSGVVITVKQIIYGIQTPWNCQVGLKNSVIQNPSLAVTGKKRFSSKVSKAIAYRSNSCGYSQLTFEEGGFGVTGANRIDLNGGYIIDPGVGLTFSAVVPDVSMGIDLEFYEQPI